MYAGSNGVDNLIATIDVNGQQIDGSTDDVLDLLNLRAKWESFGWEVINIDNGNDLQQVIDGLKEGLSLSRKQKPVCILMHTEMGHGVDFMMGSHKWHGVAPDDEQLEKALAQNPETLGDY
jgi:transketolase